MVLLSQSSPLLQFHINDISPSERSLRAVIGGKPFFNAVVPINNAGQALETALTRHKLSTSKRSLIESNLDSILSAISSEISFSHTQSHSNYPCTLNNQR